MRSLSCDELAVVEGAVLNLGIAWGNNNRVSVGTGTYGLNLQWAWGNNNHVETGKGPTMRLDWGRNNTFANK